MQTLKLLLALAPVLALALGACVHDTTSTSESSLASNLPCDVQEVLDARCAQCHGAEPKAGAPMSLATQADWAKLRAGRSVADLAKARLHDPARPMPPGPPLDAKELATLDGWLAQGARAGECTKSAAPAAPIAPPCQADTILRAPAPYEMGAKDDQYVCFGIDIARAAKRHIWAMYAEIDNANITHHIQVFQSPSPVNPTPYDCPSSAAGDWKLVGGWAPGATPIVFPAEAGMPEKAGTTHWAVQIHYNNVARRTAQRDRTGFGLCSSEQLRPHDAGVMAFGALSFAIAPRQTHDITCDFTLDERFRGAHFFGASPHMHKLGRSLAIDRLPADGSAPQSVLDARNFDFQEQAGFPANVDVAPGDKIRTRCEWQNPGDKTVRYGEGTGDEMCFGFVSYYPAVEDVYLDVGGHTVPAFNWTTPSNNLPLMDAVRKETGVAIPFPTCRETGR